MTALVLHELYDVSFMFAISSQVWLARDKTMNCKAMNFKVTFTCIQPEFILDVFGVNVYKIVA